MGSSRIFIVICFLLTFGINFAEEENSTEQTPPSETYMTEHLLDIHSLEYSTTTYYPISKEHSISTDISSEETSGKAEIILSRVETTLSELLTSTPKPKEISPGYKIICDKSSKCKCPNKDYGSISVDCNHIDLKEIPNDIKFPYNVSTVEFQGNEIATITSDMFIKGDNVINLDLSQNKIKEISGKAFQNLKKLKNLDLSHNSIWTLKQLIFYGLNNLEDVDLSYNQIRLFYPEMFKLSPRLKKLNLDSNPIIIKDDKFKYVNNLETLSLKRTGLTYLPDNFAQNLQSLKSLLISDNSFTTIPTVALKGLPNLKTLDISGNPIVMIPPYSFKGLKSLTTLYINHMRKLKSIENFAFSDLTNLVSLQASFNHLLGKIQPLALTLNETLGRTIPLKELYLRNDHLENMPQHLVDWHGLEVLDLSENPWNCDCKMSWMLNIQVKRNFLDAISCSKPQRLRGEQLSRISKSELRCESTMVGEKTVLILGIITLCLLIIIVVVMVIRKAKGRGRIEKKKRYHKSYAKVTSDGETVHYEKYSSNA